MRMMRYFSSQEVPQLEDGCRSHRQATYVTWTCWSARMEVTFLHIYAKHWKSPMQCMDIFWSDMIWGKSYLDYLFGSEDMAAAASFPNVFCKLSGLVTEVPFNCPQWWILILHFSHPHQVDPPPPHHPSTPSLTHIDTPNTQCCTRLTRRGKKKFGVQKRSDLTQTSAFHSSAQTGSRWCRKKYGFRLELKGHMMLMNVKKKVWYNVNSDACSAPTGRFVKWQGQNTARSPKKV